MTEGSKRRLVAIASIDVVGYSRLMGEDETGTLTNLQTHRSELIDPLIAQHDGRIVKTMGDGLLLEFPSVINAAQCAIDIQRGMARRNESVDESRCITFRVAINTGDVIVEGDDIFGDGVNVATRLQEIAQPGGVCLSGIVFDQISGNSDQKFEDLGFRKLKNISQPVRVYHASLATAHADEETPAAWPYLTGKKERKPVTSGGCLCGKTRFEIWGEPEAVGYCHCRFCQLALGAPLSAWVVYEEKYVSFEGDLPQIYKSSQIAERAFCGICGTSLYTYLKADKSQLFYYAMRLATMDNPEDFPPSCHFGVESKLPWLDINDSLPRIRTEDDPGISARWAAVGQPKSGQKLGTAVERMNSNPNRQK